MTLEALAQTTVPYAEITRLEAYFDAKNRLDALGISLPPEVRVLELVADWPRITVETLVERLTVRGFAQGGAPLTDDRMWKWWQANRMDANATLLHTEAFVQGIGYALVGPGERDIPRITMHTRSVVRVTLDRVTGMPVEALLNFKQPDGSQWRAYYSPGRIQYQAYSNGRWLNAAPDGFTQSTVDVGANIVPVVPYVNRSRIRDRFGRSEMLDVMRYTDAASRSITNLQVAQELLAMPLRYFMGATKDQIKDTSGKALTQLEVYLGRIIIGPEKGSVGQVPGADLTQIHSTVRLYAQLVSGSTGIPMPQLGVSSDANPASAEAVNALADRHVKKAEMKQVSFGDSHEQLMRTCAAIVDGKIDPSLDTLETRWSNAATPTLQSQAQAVTQLVQSGVIPNEVAWDMIGLTPEQKQLATAAKMDDPLHRMAASTGA